MKKSICGRCSNAITFTPYRMGLWAGPDGSAYCPAASGLEHEPTPDSVEIPEGQ